MVGEVGVLGEERAVEVGAVGVVDDGAFGAVFGVVAVAAQDTPERFGAGAEEGASAVVFEADERGASAGGGVPMEDDVADAAGHGGAGVDGVEVEEAEAGQAIAGGGLVVVAKELVAAADDEHGKAVLEGGAEGG